MVKMKRGQLAATIIILVLLGIILLIIFGVTPEVRRELLNISKPSGIQPTEGKTIVLGRGLVIGGTEGEQKFSKYFTQDFTLSKVSKNETIIDENFTLSSNLLFAILGSPSKEFPISKITENTKKVFIELTMLSRESTPGTRVVLNNENIFEKSMNAGDKFTYDFEPKEGDNKLQVVCLFQGLALYQACHYNLRVIKLDELTEGAEKILSFHLDRGEEAEIFKIYLNTLEANGSLTIYLDDKVYFRIRDVESYAQYNFSLYSSEINLGEGDHFLRLKAGPNSNIHVASVRIMTEYGKENKKEERFSFSINKTEFLTKKVKLSLKIDEVLVPGSLWINIIETNKYKYVAAGATLGEAIEIELTKDDLKVGTNTIRIYAPSGKFRISELKVVVY